MFYIWGSFIPWYQERMGLAKKPAEEASLLKTILHESNTEVFAIDAESLRIDQANPAALSNLQYTLRELRQLTPMVFLHGDHEARFKALCGLLQSGKKRRVSLDTSFRRKDGSSYPVEMRLFLSIHKSKPHFIAIANDVSAREASRRALAYSESDLRAIVSNIPGMAYQVFRKHDGGTSLRYVSEQSSMLLGIKAKTLRAKPDLFFDLILPEDRPSYLATLAKTGGSHMTFNWEGRIWVEAWKDVKWVNIRVSQREVPEGIMWDGIMLNVTRSKQYEEEIKRSRAQLSALASHVESVKEQERLNIAREIHDDLGGNLTAVKIGLSWLARHTPPGQSELREKAEYLDSVIDQTLDAAHRIASNMRPAIVDFGIVSAIEWQLKRFTLNLDIPFEFSSTHRQIPLDSDASIAVFRIVQEALTNIAKHARASRVGVRLEKLKDELHLEIVDDGVGPLAVRSRNHKKSFGILGMTERAAALGGKLDVSAAPGSGTVVSLQLPLAIPTPYVAHKHEKKTK